MFRLPALFGARQQDYVVTEPSADSSLSLTQGDRGERTREKGSAGGPHASTLHASSWPAHMGTTTLGPKPYSSGMVDGRRTSVTVPLLRGSP